MLDGLQWLLLILPLQIEQIGGSDTFARKSSASCRNRGNAAPRRLHPPHPYPQ
jgi:hypothetical protein